MEELKDFLTSRKKITLLMTAMNLLIFVVFTIIGDTEDVHFMMEHGACFTPAILAGEYYRLFTGMFLHFGIYHVVYNMICLIFIGDILETEIGSIKYLFIYVLGGLAGNLLSMAMDIKMDFYVVSAGASGAVFAIMGALLWVIIRNKGYLGNITLQRFGMLAVLSLLQGFTETGTDNAAHIGGFVTGFLLSVLLYRKKKIQKPTYDRVYF